jgi:hypothetical protein
MGDAVVVVQERVETGRVTTAKREDGTHLFWGGGLERSRRGGAWLWVAVSGS